MEKIIKRINWETVIVSVVVVAFVGFMAYCALHSA